MSPLDQVASLGQSGGLPLTWLLLRTSGVVTLALLTVSVVLGVAGPAVRRPSARLLMITVHRTAAVTGLALVAAHVLLAVADSFVEIAPLAVVVPGASVWEPLWIGLGAVALDLLVVVGITTATRLRGPVLWRRAHLLAYPAWLLAWGHALGAGTDAGSRPMLLMAIVGALAVAVATIARLVRPDVTRISQGLDGAADRNQPVTIGGRR